MMSKPNTIKFIIGLLTSKILVYFLSSLFISYFLFERPDIDANSGFRESIRGFLSGIADVILEFSRLENAYDKDPEYAVSFIGMRYGLIIIRSLLLLYFLVKRKRLGFWITFALDALLTLASGIPVVSIIVIILMNTKSAKSFFKGAKHGVGDATVIDGAFYE